MINTCTTVHKPEFPGRFAVREIIIFVILLSFPFIFTLPFLRILTFVYREGLCFSYTLKLIFFLVRYGIVFLGNLVVLLILAWKF